ncbi:hypothetical protein [uncultured Polaribacter sp.]|uniref:hypothetical protein n=1 Tax=uncultured Polaribacter sp. TaxID=174711 RepID=UPI0026343869|nr:hypothetical protein [uncultured Polaribacter sp.]
MKQNSSFLIQILFMPLGLLLKNIQAQGYTTATSHVFSAIETITHNTSSQEVCSATIEEKIYTTLVNNILK